LMGQNTYIPLHNHTNIPSLAESNTISFLPKPFMSEVLTHQFTLTTPHTMTYTESSPSTMEITLPTRPKSMGREMSQSPSELAESAGSTLVLHPRQMSDSMPSFTPEPQNDGNKSETPSTPVISTRDDSYEERYCDGRSGAQCRCS
jgi:hypothetical protein